VTAQIEGLDKMVKNLKHRRHLCAEAMNKDAANIAWIDAELQRLESQYRPLCTRLEEREERMKSVETNLELAERTMLQIMGTTKTTARSGIKATALMLKNEASSKIAEERGFSMAPSTTFHPSKSNQQNSKK
jgi:hypothetical protein